MEQSFTNLIGGNPHSSSIKRLVGLVLPSPSWPPSSSSASGNNNNGAASGEKQVKHLVKKLRRVDLVKALERAVSESNPHIGCITAAVAAAEQEPSHVTACRLWRWPDLQSVQELRPLDNCQMPYTTRSQTEVCVNPHHYTRLPLSSPAQDPVLICRGGSSSGVVGGDVACPSIAAAAPAAATDDSKAVSPSACMSEDNDGPHSEGGRIGALSPADQQQQQQPLYQVHYTEAEHWCSIHYYELAARVGDAYQALSPFVTVDGGTDPSSRNRFCLGLLSNVNRSLTVEQTRRSIGAGVGLYYVNGEVHAECLSESPIFVQSPNGNIRQGWHPATVCRIPPGCNLCVFSNADFGNQLRQTALTKGFDEVYALTKMCTIRIAFVKGWGSEYQRQLVTATPCWIEVHLNGPLHWLDQVLAAMGSPTYVCSSMS